MPNPTSSSSTCCWGGGTPSTTDWPPSPYSCCYLVYAGVELSRLQSIRKVDWNIDPTHQRLFTPRSQIDLHHQRTPPGFSSTLLRHSCWYCCQYPEIALPEDVHKKFKAHGYNWLIRVFGLTKKAVPPFLMNIYSKFYPEEMPKLPQK